MSESTQVPRRFIVAIAIASGAVTIAVAISVGAFTGYIGRRPAPAVVEPTPAPAPEPPAPTTVLVPIQPAQSATRAPETQAAPPTAIDDSLLTYTADPPRFANDDHRRDRDRDRDEEYDDD